MQADEHNPYRSPEVHDAPLPGRSDDHEKLVVLATFRTPIDAHVLRNRLLENGIDAKVSNESTTALFGSSMAGPSSAFWIEVLIRESDAEAALKIKNQYVELDQANPVAIPEWTCSCGETVDAGFAICWNCGAEHQE